MGLKQIRDLGPGQEVWDAAVPGFGARRQKGAAISYVLIYRMAGRPRRYTIGRHGAPWTPDAARDEARRLLGEKAQGVDPAADKQAMRKTTTIAELCDTYLSDAESGRRRTPKKVSTLLSDRGRIKRHINPILGRLAVAAVTSEEIER